MDNEAGFINDIKALAESIHQMNKMAVVTYTPQVEDICRRKATEREVEQLIDYMLPFLGDSEMLLLFKKLCSHYYYTYTEAIQFYILHYLKEYDSEKLVGTEFEYLLKEDEIPKD